MRQLIQEVFWWYHQKNMPPKEDPNKVERYQVWLNGITPGQNWIPLDGWNALTTCYYTPQGQLIFNPNHGRPTKAFFNEATGEVRNFDARYFYA